MPNFITGNIKPPTKETTSMNAASTAPEIVDREKPVLESKASNMPGMAPRLRVPNIPTPGASSKTLSGKNVPQAASAAPALKRQAVSINLVPEDTLKIVKEELPERMKYFFLFTIITLAVIIGLWAVWSWMIIKVFTEVQMVSSKINATRLEALQYRSESNEIIKLRQRYNVINYLLEKHIYWTKFFSLLEKYTINDVYFTNFSVSSTPGANIVLQAKAKSLRAVADQMVVLKKSSDFASDVRVDAVSIGSTDKTADLSEPVVTFDLSVTLDKNVFYELIKESK